MKINLEKELDHVNIEVAKKWLKKSPEDLETYIQDRIKAKQQTQIIIELASIVAALAKHVKF